MDFTDILLKYRRVVLAGGPRAGKTTLVRGRILDRLVVSTDSYLDLEWGEVPGRIIDDIRGAGDWWLLEGVRAPWCLRQGLEADCAVWVRGARCELTAGQQALAKACRSVWDEWVAEARIPVFEV